MIASVAISRIPRIPRQFKSRLATQLVRSLTSSTPNNNNNNNDDEMKNYLTSLGVKAELQQDLLATVRPMLVSGTRDETPSVATLSATFQDSSDLVALAKSLEEQQQQKERKKKKRQRPQREIVFRITNNNNAGDDSLSRESKIMWKFGQSLLDLAQSVPGQQAMEQIRQDDGSDIMEGPCGGQMNCSTCHVYLDTATYECLEPPVEAELDMLDLAYDRRDTSRLGCQVKFNHRTTRGDHDIVVTLPSQVSNQWES